MTTSPNTDRPVMRRRKRRIRSSRKIRFFLMSIGLFGLLLGAGLVLYGVVGPNRQLRLLGIVYIACAIAMLLVRTAMEQYDRVRRRWYTNDG